MDLIVLTGHDADAWGELDQIGDRLADCDPADLGDLISVDRDADGGDVQVSAVDEGKGQRAVRHAGIA